MTEGEGSTHQSLAGKDLQQLDEHLAVPQVGVQVRDLAVDPDEVGVDPLGERFLLHMLSLVWGERAGLDWTTNRRD